MMAGAGDALPIVSMSEAQAYVRIETGEEEAVLAGLIRSASGLCEQFLNLVVIERSFTQDLPASAEWQRLSLTPVTAIGSVESIDQSGATSALPAGGYAIDIDASGDGWVRLTQSASASRIRVTATAGLGSSENDVPELIRQGVLRLVAHLYAWRDGGGGEPPAAVTALWRPYRRMRLS